MPRYDGPSRAELEQAARELVAEESAGRDLKTPEEIRDQRAKGWPDFHPEDYCHKCGQRNIKGWYTDSALWNQAAPVEAIWCPQCFVEAYEEATGERPIWRLAPAALSDERSALIRSEAAMRHRLADAERAWWRTGAPVAPACPGTLPGVVRLPPSGSVPRPGGGLKATHSGGQQHE